jgi:hypothetical protein
MKLTIYNYIWILVKKKLKKKKLNFTLLLSIIKRIEKKTIYSLLFNLNLDKYILTFIYIWDGKYNLCDFWIYYSSVSKWWWVGQKRGHVSEYREQSSMDLSSPITRLLLVSQKPLSVSVSLPHSVTATLPRKME